MRRNKWDYFDIDLEETRAMRCWSFHTVALASGTAEKELTAKRELLNRLNGDVTLTSWTRSCSYRVVGRAELEELVRVTHAEELETKRCEEKALKESTSVEETGDATAGVETEEEKVETVAVTPPLLALAFQRLVNQDKREFLVHQQTRAIDAEVQPYPEENETEYQESQTPARVYLLVDYPSSLPEIDALLRLGDVGSASQVTDGPEKLPLLPLIDGVVLLTDLVVRSRSPTNLHVPHTSAVKEDNSDRRTSVMETSVFQTANGVVKAFYEAAQVGGVEWSDFIFTNMDCCSAEGSVLKKSEELEQELVVTVETIAIQKFAFKNWVASTMFSAIPGFVNEGDDTLYKTYETMLSGVFPGSVGVSTVLFAITEAVATACSPLTTPPTSCNTSQNNPTDLSHFEEFLEHGDLIACRVAGAQLDHEALEAEGIPCYLPHGNHRIDDIERVMWMRSDLPGVGNEGRKAMPRVPELSQPERSVRNTELATFYTSPRFNGSLVHLTRQLLQVEEVLGTCWRRKLQPRAFIEKLTRAVLPQRIALVLQQNTPDIYSSYYAPTDSLLLACLPKTAPGRMQLSSWIACDHVRHRPAFKYWKREQLASQEYLTPRTETAAGSCVPLSAGQLALVGNHTWSMYPADHSVVRLYQTPQGFMWLTVYHHGETFGLRSGVRRVKNFTGNESTYKEQRSEQSMLESECMIPFIATFQDESTLYISEGRRKFPKKPDKFSTIVVTNSFPNGLVVSACSDGTIVQRYAHTSNEKVNTSVVTSKSGRRNSEVSDTGAANGVQDEDEGEKYRVIYGKGSVLRVLRCGRKEVMLASGIVRVIRGCKKCSYDNKCHPPLVTTLTVDPETNALVERHPNGVIVVTFTSGARATYHLDGTRMYMNAKSTHVFVKKRGFADVCIDVEVNVTAQLHAAGERIAVTKGGLRIRSVVNAYDGTSIEISYNTKVTAQVNGRVTTRKPSGQVIVAKDSGRVEYRPLDRSLLESKDDDDRDVTSHNGVYYFDCRHGQFQLCDKEQNQFCVKFNGTDEQAGPTVAVDLAGVVSDTEAARYDVDNIPAQAVINEPIQPHIFVLNGDGTGVEILRPRDITEYVEDPALETQASDLTDLGLSIPRCHVFLRRLSAPGDASRRLKPLFNDPKLQDEMLDLQRPVATAGKYLPSYFAEAKHTCVQQQFTTVRRVQQIQPLSADELNEMHAGWAKWEQWQKDREANKECYKVVDPRQPDVIAQEIAMQKKVLAAYKATRARKKMARQKAREMKAKGTSEEVSPELRMETVQEGEEALEDEESDDEFGQFGSDMSDNDVGDTVDVDDPMELLWSSFSQADAEGRGLLSIAQTRLGVVNVLGIGVTTSELTEALVQFKIPHPFNVSFDVFADLVAFFRKGDGDKPDPEVSGTGYDGHIPSLKAMTPDQHKGHSTPRGSAAEAIRARYRNDFKM